MSIVKTTLNNEAAPYVKKSLQPIEWDDGVLRLLDQRKLPAMEVYIELTTAAATADAIKTMVVRGAPAIGITAAYGVALAFAHRQGDYGQVQDDIQQLWASRPTAVNLHHALKRMQKVLEQAFHEQLPYDIVLGKIIVEAQSIQQEDLEANYAMAEYGMEVLRASCEQRPVNVLTHCNTGSLATGGLGTALGIIKQGTKQGVIKEIYASETRPWLQGSRLTVFELVYEGIAVKLLVEGAVASLFASGAVDWFIAGADRITANGDVANKVGTLSHALLAKHFGVKVMIAAPMTTVDHAMPSGAHIPIESRPGDEILAAAGYAPETDIEVYNPVFDVTPASLIDVIVTERGAHKPGQLHV